MNATATLDNECFNRVRGWFEARGYVQVACERARDGHFLLLCRADSLHLVYCLAGNPMVSTIEVEACAQARRRWRAQSAAIVAPLRFTAAARREAQRQHIEWLAV
jgi:hypothetical protein